MGRTVELRVGGQNYRVVSSASEEELEHLAAIVNRKVGELAPQARADGAQRLLLVAMALAHDVEEERAQGEALRMRTREFLEAIVGRVDAALSESISGEPGEGNHDRAIEARTQREGSRGGSGEANEREDRFT